MDSGCNFQGTVALRSFLIRAWIGKVCESEKLCHSLVFLGRVIYTYRSGPSVHTDAGHLYTQIRVICTHRSGPSAHTHQGHLHRRLSHGVGWGGWGGVGQKHSCLLLNLLGTRAHMNIGMGWGGWGGTITFMSSLAQSTWHTQTHEHWDGVGWVGWDNYVHVFFSSIYLAHANAWTLGWGGVGGVGQSRSCLL